MALGIILQRTTLSKWQQFTEAPLPTLARIMYGWRQSLFRRTLTPLPTNYTEVVCISDTHNRQPLLPAGDILVHAGDLTESGTAVELQTQLHWIASQPHRHKIVIAGNHDIVLDAARAAESGMVPADRINLHWHDVQYLQSSATNVEVGNTTLRIYGHPSTRKQGNWAFQHDRARDVFGHQVPPATDILITHSPPIFHLDLAGRGDPFLLKELWRVRPKLHIFGHLHEGHGKEILVYDRFTALYERLCAGEAGFLQLIMMALLLLQTLIAGIDRGASRTILLNGALVGGRYNRLKHKAHVVYL